MCVLCCVVLCCVAFVVVVVCVCVLVGLFCCLWRLCAHPVLLLASVRLLCCCCCWFLPGLWLLFERGAHASARAVARQSFARVYKRLVPHDWKPWNQSNLLNLLLLLQLTFHLVWYHVVECPVIESPGHIFKTRRPQPLLLNLLFLVVYLSLSCLLICWDLPSRVFVTSFTLLITEGYYHCNCNCYFIFTIIVFHSQIRFMFFSDFLTVLWNNSTIIM